MLVFYSSDLLRKDPQFKVQPNYNHHKSLILKKCLICQGHLRRPTINNKGHLNVRYAAKTFYIKLVLESSQFQYMTLEVDLQETHFPHRLQTVTFKQKTICRFLTQFLTIKNTQLYIQQKNSLLVSFGKGLGAKSGKTNNGNWDETSKKGIQEHHLNNEHFLTLQTREKTGGSSSPLPRGERQLKQRMPLKEPYRRPLPPPQIQPEEAKISARALPSPHTSEGPELCHPSSSSPSSSRAADQGRGNPPSRRLGEMQRREYRELRYT